MDEHSPSEFYYPEDLETFDVETETGIKLKQASHARKMEKSTSQQQFPVFSAVYSDT